MLRMLIIFISDNIKYIVDLLQISGIDIFKYARTPMSIGIPLSQFDGEFLKDMTHFIRLVGEL